MANGWPPHPLLYEINTRVWVRELSARAGRRLTLDTIPPEELERIAALGFDAVWLMGVWTTGLAAIRLRARMRAARAITGAPCPTSPTATSSARPTPCRVTRCRPTSVAPPPWPRCARASPRYGIRLMLDFVPNHTATDQRVDHREPAAFVAGHRGRHRPPPRGLLPRRAAASSSPTAAIPTSRPGRTRPRWTTRHRRRAAPGMSAQLQAHRHAVRRRALRHGHAAAARRDREDLGGPARAGDWITESFWAEAIPAVRERHPGFLFMAEAYWGLEWDLQQQGFDFTYDKTLYDRLRSGDARGRARATSAADPAFADRCARFLENHDEPRAAAAFGVPDGVRGRRRHLPRSGPAAAPRGPARRPAGPPPRAARPASARSRSTRHVRAFYARCSPSCAIRPSATAVRAARRLARRDGDRTFDGLVAFGWREEEADGGPCLVVVVNLRPEPAWARVPLGRPGLRMRPHLSPARSPGRRELPARRRRGLAAPASSSPCARARPICSRSRWTDRALTAGARRC